MRYVSDCRNLFRYGTMRIAPDGPAVNAVGQPDERTPVDEAMAAYSPGSDRATMREIVSTLYNVPAPGLGERLLGRFGSLRASFGVAKTAGASMTTERVAAFFRIMPGCYRRMLTEGMTDISIRSERDAVLYFVSTLFGKNNTELAIFHTETGAVTHIERLPEIKPFREAVSVPCGTGDRGVLWLRYMPHALPYEPGLDRLAVVSRAAFAAEELDIMFTDYIDLTPAGFFSLRRTLAGGGPEPLYKASDVPYMYCDRLTDKLNKLILDRAGWHKIRLRRPII